MRDRRVGVAGKAATLLRITSRKVELSFWASELKRKTQALRANRFLARHFRARFQR